MNGQSSATSPSSGKFISGLPWAITEMEKQTRGFPSLMGAVLAAALQEEEDRLRRQYTDRGIAAEVSVKYDDEHMQIVYGASGSDAAEAEYGGTTRGPQALLRKGAVRGASKIQKALEKGTKA